MRPADAAMARHNVLYLAHRIPYPPDKGDKIRSYHQVAYLSRRHNVSCAFFVDDQADWEHVDALRALCRNVCGVPISRSRAVARGACAMATGGTMTEGYYRDGRMWRLLRDWCRNTAFDAALIYSSGMAAYRRAVRAGRHVLDLCDWDSCKWASYARRSTGLHRWAYALEARRLRRREFQWLETFDACTVATQAEAAAVDLPSPARRPYVIGNGAVVGPEPRATAERAGPRIGFVGQMDYPPNVDAVRWFAECILPRIRSRVADATFEIVGRAPSRDVLALADRPGVRVVGAVEDVRSLIERHAVSVAPLRMGWGIQNKVLEAMAAARPVVLTPTAAAGIDAVDRQHLIIADRPSAIAGQVVSLLKDPVRRGTLGAAARARVADRYRWDDRLAALEALLFARSSRIRRA